MSGLFNNTGSGNQQTTPPGYQPPNSGDFGPGFGGGMTPNFGQTIGSSEGVGNFTGNLSPGFTTGQQNNGGYGNNPWGPSMGGTYGPNDPGAWNVPNSPSQFYGIPNISSMMPNRGWMQQLDPNIQAGLWEPWQQGANMLGERMGAAGQGGSARGGMSGNAAAGFGKYYADATKNVGLTAWDMVKNPKQMGWAAGLDRSKQLANEQLASRKFPYQALPGFFGGSQSTPIVSGGGSSFGESMLSMLPLAFMK